MSKKERELENIEEVMSTFMEKRRPPKEIRDKLDIGFRRKGQTIEIVEIRPNWQDSSIKQEIPVAKTKYIKSRSVWRIYWMRANLKWYPYDPVEEVNTLSEFLEIVDEDSYGCFWG